MGREFVEKVEASPIIAAVKNDEELENCLKSDDSCDHRQDQGQRKDRHGTSGSGFGADAEGNLT